MVFSRCSPNPSCLLFPKHNDPLCLASPLSRSRAGPLSFARPFFFNLSVPFFAFHRLRLSRFFFFKGLPGLRFGFFTAGFLSSS